MTTTAKQARTKPVVRKKVAPGYRKPPRIPKKKKGLPKDPRGRRSLYLPAYDELCKEACLLGATNKSLGELFDVSERTIDTWKNEYASFAASMRAGKLLADGKVASALFDRAVGMSYQDNHVSVYEGDVTITPVTKFAIPDVGAIKMWLTNRQPKLWKSNIIDVPEGRGIFNLWIAEALAPVVESA